MMVKMTGSEQVGDMVGGRRHPLLGRSGMAIGVLPRRDQIRKALRNDFGLRQTFVSVQLFLWQLVIELFFAYQFSHR
jgi:hypothetical protein